MANPQQGIRINSREMERFLKSDDARGPCREIAEKIARRAIADAPVDTGEYRDGIVVEDATTDRAVVRVRGRDPKTVLIEARTGNLKRAMRR